MGYTREGVVLKRLLLLSTLSIAVMLVLVPVAGAQEIPVIEENIGGPQQYEAAVQCRAQGLIADETGECETVEAAQARGVIIEPLPDTGGISLLLPAAMLLLGSGILGLAIARRNS